MMSLFTLAWLCLVPQKGRGWLIKYWQMFDLILANFSKDYYGMDIYI